MKASSTYRLNRNKFTLREERFPVSGEDQVREFANRNRGYQYELGGEVETGVGQGRLKLIALSSGTHSTWVAGPELRRWRDTDTAAGAIGL